ncbi:MAG: 50S ribosomal protein L25 [Clostridia bacterium]|nr:50S ribosomal protein L25 [Clostridia bacterium]MDD4542388.1 50S ribosomal protein L25 [Clostridia bacterium]
MFTLKVEKRENDSKGRQLRRQGIIPAVLYGKHLEESVSLQLPVQEAQKFLRTNFIGSKVELEIGKKKHLAILKEATYTPGVNKLEHLSFQALKAGEKVKSVAKVILSGKEKVKEGLVMQILDEISYIALPMDIVDRIEVNVEKLVLGDVITVADLEFVKNKSVEVQNALDTVVVTVTMPKKHVEETEETETAADEVALVSDTAEDEKAKEEASE